MEHYIYKITTNFLMKQKIEQIIVCICAVVIIGHLTACVDPVTPEFEFTPDIIFIDAFAVTDTGQSYVQIDKSNIDQFRYFTEGVENAVVTLINEDKTENILFIEEPDGAYVSPPDFSVSEGETWRLMVELTDGRRYISTPETVRKSVAISNISASYSDEVVFDDSFNAFVPGHAITADLVDPSDERNYYLWKYRTFEQTTICKTCIAGRLRNGECEPFNQPFGANYFNYLCDVPCWTIDYGDEILIYDDEFSNGSVLEDQLITYLPFYKKRNILIEVIQYSLSQSAYEYYQIIDDLINENTGLNAPPPAALIGNLVNEEDPRDMVLGQFTATGVSSKRLFIDRSLIMAPPLRPDPPIKLEPCDNCPFDLRFFKCAESRTRTANKPLGWN